MSKQKETGFTLIELVIVIVIIGILAAIALPKFAGISSDARAGVVKGVAGSMAGANAQIFARASTSGALSSSASVTINNQTVNTAFGFAAAAADLSKVMDLTPPDDFAISGNDIQHARATTSASCKVTYTPPATSSAQPAYTVDVTGC